METPMTDRQKGESYYNYVNRQRKELNTQLRAISAESSRLSEEFSNAASLPPEKQEELKKAREKNSAAFESLFKAFDALREKEENPPWIELSRNLLYANYKMVEELTRDGKLIRLMNEEGVSILGQPAYAGDDRIAKLMIERGANLETAGGELRETPLQTSVYKDNAGVFKMLVKAGADTTVLNGAGKSLREMAEQYGADDILGELDKMGRKGAQKPAKKKTAFPK